MRWAVQWLAVAALVGSGSLAHAQALPAADVQRVAEDFFAKRPSEGFGVGLSREQAIATQKAFVSRLSRKLGKRVGHKVGLVTREAQERLGVNSPVRGVLLAGMMLKDGAEVPAQFGPRPLCEADLIVVVKDKGINQARTPLEVAQHLKEIVAFIELPDALLATNQSMDGPLLTAINVGARLGVLGDRLPVQPTPEFVHALAEMAVTVADQTGKELGQAQGKLILNHPLNAVLWLQEDLAKSGERLKAGDLISLGSLKLVTPQAGQTITVRYEGLPGGTLKASVRFR